MTHGTRELDEDAAKLEALGVDPGPTLEQAGLVRPKQYTFTLNQLREADEAMAGYCIACGAYRDMCEPDANEYECEECGEHKVYGAAELVIMGYGYDG